MVPTKAAYRLPVGVLLSDVVRRLRRRRRCGGSTEPKCHQDRFLAEFRTCRIQLESATCPVLPFLCRYVVVRRCDEVGLGFCFRENYAELCIFVSFSLLVGLP